MCERTFVGEEEVIKMNAELIDGQIFYFAAPRMNHQRLQAELGFGHRNRVKVDQQTRLWNQDAQISDSWCEGVLDCRSDQGDRYGVLV